MRDRSDDHQTKREEASTKGAVSIFVFHLSPFSEGGGGAGGGRIDGGALCANPIPAYSHFLRHCISYVN